MHRISGTGYQTAINAAFEMLPDRYKDRFNGVDFLTDVDPGFAGLHFYKTPLKSDGYTEHPYNIAPHFVHLEHQPHISRDLRKPTIVLPTRLCGNPYSVLHELGHYLHVQINYGFTTNIPYTEYGKTNQWEAFADNFKIWAYREDWLEIEDPEMSTFLNSLN